MVNRENKKDLWGNSACRFLLGLDGSFFKMFVRFYAAV